MSKIKSLFNKKYIPFLGLVGATYAAFTIPQVNNISRLVGSSFSANRDEYITSSMLGMHNPMEIYSRLANPEYYSQHRYKTSEDKRKSDKRLEQGNLVHESVANSLISSGFAKKKEHYVEDFNNKVFGYVDLMSHDDKPIEVKSVSLKDLNRMTGPKPEHISQANFYAIATNSPYSYLHYSATENPSITKTFTVNQDIARYEADLNRIGNIQQSLPARSIANFSNFRPINSWFGGGINYNVSYLKKSKYESQKLKLSNLTMSQYMPQDTYSDHANFSRAGV